jgi:hypothetical protein
MNAARKSPKPPDYCVNYSSYTNATKILLKSQLNPTCFKSNERWTKEHYSTFFLQIDGSNEEKDFILKYTGQWWTWSMAKSAAPLYPHESHSHLYFRNSLNLLCAVATFDLLQSCNLANSDGLVLQVSTRRPGLDHLGPWMTLLGYKWSPTKEELLLEKHNNLLKSLFL